MVFPVPVADMVTFLPLIGFPLASFTVMVMVEVDVPSAITSDVAVSWDVEAESTMLRLYKISKLPGVPSSQTT